MNISGKVSVYEGQVIESGDRIVILASLEVVPLGQLTQTTPENNRDGTFPPVPNSICGNVQAVSDTLVQGMTVKSKKCTCNSASVVGVDGSGRTYLTCRLKGCKFFRWADAVMDPPYYNLAHRKVTWKPLSPPEYRSRPSDMSRLPEYMIQGSLGDCWLISSFSVLCENPRRLSHVLGDATEDATVSFNFCYNGIWTTITVDRMVPVFNTGRRKELEAFARVKDNVAFGPFIEKAYAKMYGYYAALNGGFMSEAFFDMTGCPTESIDLDEKVDIDMLWAQLKTWKESGFMIACATDNHPVVDENDGDQPPSTKGLVTVHAYSLKDVVELFNVSVGRQTKITDFAKGSTSQVQRDTIPHLRLVQLRNPWGKGEWKGDWSGKSDKWTRNLIEQMPSFAERNQKGTFWIELEDLVKGFAEVEVAKTHADWFTSVFQFAESAVIRLDRLLGPGTGTPYLNIRISSTAEFANWTYVTLVQPSTRGRKGHDVYYADVHMLLKGPDGNVKAAMVGRVDRVTTLEAMLEPNTEYELVMFSLHNLPFPNGWKPVIRVFSAQPVLVSISEEVVAGPIVATPQFEQLLVTFLPLHERVRVTESISVSIQSTSGLAVFALSQSAATCADHGMDRMEVYVHMRTQGNNVLSVGRWRRTVSLDYPVVGTVVLGFVTKLKHKSYGSKMPLSEYDFDIDIVPLADDSVAGATGEETRPPPKRHRPPIQEVIELD